MNLLEEVRATEIPGKRGGEFLYAKAIYAYFNEIEKLKAEGFTFITICKSLERRGILPKNSDPHSFRRAYRREIIRRQRTALKEVNADDRTKRNIKAGENVQKYEISRKGEQRKLGIPFTPARTKNSKAGLHVNTDNTFDLTPINDDDMPDNI